MFLTTHFLFLRLIMAQPQGMKFSMPVCVEKKAVNMMVGIAFHLSHIGQQAVGIRSTRVTFFVMPLMSCQQLLVLQEERGLSLCSGMVFQSKHFLTQKKSRLLRIGCSSQILRGFAIRSNGERRQSCHSSGGLSTENSFLRSRKIPVRRTI